ncbi:MAG TPA: toll/interleukin-1 receptor domain-containing protein [Bryobacteraceae bacterium]|nr:toll/interleukin-1 receptor domain-containing protein [Bryobacteraceae bacterium]
MANQEHLDILAKGVGPWNAWRDRTPVVPLLEFADLRGAHLDYVRLGGARLKGAKLAGAHLRHADLTGAQLAGADLARAHLSGADLSGADLNGADLSDADLANAVLIRAILRGAVLNHATLCAAHLSGADLRGAHLDEADFGSASLGNTYFANVDLSTAKGLDAARSLGPSSIGLDTIYRSQGKIPEPFLRGAGVPENFIAFMKSLTGAALEFYSCFISYSTQDQEFAGRLHADLQARGVRCWFAPHDIQGGRKLIEQLDEAILVHDKLLLILSDASMNSPWVKTEIANAREREEQQKRQKLFPIALVPFDRIREWKLFDADRGIDSAREIREYFMPDFSNWKDYDSYQKAFERLLRDLKT